MAASSKSDKKQQNSDNIDKLEPKLTILKKRNPQVFDWVQGLSRGKLTTFIYEVLDLYMKQGLLLDDDWIHPNNQQTLSLLEKASSVGQKSNEEFEKLEQTLLEMKAQLNFLIQMVHNQNVMQTIPSMMGGISHPFMANGMPNGGTPSFPFNQSSPNFGQNEQNINNGLNSDNNSHSELVKNQQKATQSENETVSLSPNSDKNTSSNSNDDTFIVVLEDVEPETKKPNKEPESVAPIGDAGGFSVY